MEASGWLLEARTSQAEHQVAQRWLRVLKSRLGGGWPPEALRRPTLQPTPVPPSGWGAAGLHGVASLRRPSGGPLLLCL